ncbi:MAG: APC family permease [Candidatus Bathyarchaeota archaeon]|jgi:APA family basic amino acid/polyamine antiporter
MKGQTNQWEDNIELVTERKFGLFGAVMMGLGAAIGFEVFVLLDYAYFHLAGPSMISALFLCGFINILTMFSYSELSAAIPKMGGEYTYTKAAFGGLTAFMAGCLRWLASVFGAALAAIVFTRQLGYFFSILVPMSRSFILVNTPLIVAILVIILAVLDIRGVKEVTTLIVGAFLAIFVFFLANGLSHGIAPPEVLPTPSFGGLSGFFAATAYTFTMFVGMRALVAGAPQIKDPGKNVPKALLLSTVLLIAVYCSVAYVAVGVVPLGDYDEPFLNLAAANIMGGIGGILFAVAGMVASVSSVATAMMVQSSLLGGMSRDGYLPKVLLRVHRRFGTRYVAVIASSLFVIMFSVIGAVEFLGYAASFGSLLVFALVNLSLMKLREKEPHLKRPFKAPLYPLTPIAGIVLSFLLLVFPMILRDVNAESALISSLGLVALVLATYYLRMVGRYRLRVAMGGVSLGMGILLALLAYLSETSFELLIIRRFPPSVLVFVSAVSILAGILNITAHARKIF